MSTVLRKIALYDGTGMGGELIIFKTNAPAQFLKELEEKSTIQVLAGKDHIIWADECANKGYIFEYVDHHQHITAYGTSVEWRNRKYAYVKEEYFLI